MAQLVRADAPVDIAQANEGLRQEILVRQVPRRLYEDQDLLGLTNTAETEGVARQKALGDVQGMLGKSFVKQLQALHSMIFLKTTLKEAKSMKATELVVTLGKSTGGSWHQIDLVGERDLWGSRSNAGSGGSCAGSAFQEDTDADAGRALVSQPPMLPLETTHGDGEQGSEGSEFEAAQCSSGISGRMSEVVTPGSSADVIDVGADAGSASPDASFNGDDVSAYGSLATASLAAGAVGDRSQGYTGDWPSPFGWDRRSRSNAGSGGSCAGTALDEDTDADLDMSGSRLGSPLTPAAIASEADQEAETQSVAVEIGDMRSRRIYTCTFRWCATQHMSPQQMWERVGLRGILDACWDAFGALQLSLRYRGFDCFLQGHLPELPHAGQSIILRVTVQEFLQGQTVIHYSCTWSLKAAEGLTPLQIWDCLGIAGPLQTAMTQHGQLSLDAPAHADVCLSRAIRQEDMSGRPVPQITPPPRMLPRILPGLSVDAGRDVLDRLTSCFVPTYSFWTDVARLGTWVRVQEMQRLGCCIRSDAMAGRVQPCIGGKKRTITFSGEDPEQKAKVCAAVERLQRRATNMSPADLDAAVHRLRRRFSQPRGHGLTAEKLKLGGQLRHLQMTQADQVLHGSGLRLALQEVKSLARYLTLREESASGPGCVLAARPSFAAVEEWIMSEFHFCHSRREEDPSAQRLCSRICQQNLPVAIANCVLFSLLPKILGVTFSLETDVFEAVVKALGFDDCILKPEIPLAGSLEAVLKRSLPESSWKSFPYRTLIRPGTSKTRMLAIALRSIWLHSEQIASTLQRNAATLDVRARSRAAVQLLSQTLEGVGEFVAGHVLNLLTQAQKQEPPLYDAELQCVVGNGTMAALHRLFPHRNMASQKEYMDAIQLLRKHVLRPQFAPRAEELHLSNVEHALCEFNKWRLGCLWMAAKRGLRTSEPGLRPRRARRALASLTSRP
ncbi:unnamed protein product [Symbiodinium sp. KB8]|nr:unnamed protein product [Symbiodinium sp. KB8]